MGLGVILKLILGGALGAVKSAFGFLVRNWKIAVPAIAGALLVWYVLDLRADKAAALEAKGKADAALVVEKGRSKAFETAFHGASQVAEENAQAARALAAEAQRQTDIAAKADEDRKRHAREVDELKRRIHDAPDFGDAVPPGLCDTLNQLRALAGADGPACVARAGGTGPG